MRKTVYVTAIVMGIVFLTSSTAMAKNHHKSHKWWRKPFTQLWNAVEDLQDQIIELQKAMDASRNAPPEPQSEPAPAATVLCPNCNFTDLDVGAINLPGAYLVGSFMPNAKFVGANLSGANLSATYLGGADFSGADLTGANLSNCYMNDTILTGADLSGAILDGSLMQTTQWDNTVCPDGTNSNDNANSCLYNLLQP